MSVQLLSKVRRLVESSSTAARSVEVARLPASFVLSPTSPTMSQFSMGFFANNPVAEQVQFDHDLVVGNGDPLPGIGVNSTLSELQPVLENLDSFLQFKATLTSGEMLEFNKFFGSGVTVGELL